MPEAAPTHQIVRFGVFELDLRAGELHKRGLKVRLQEKPQQVLALLLEKPGEVVTREELRQRLWPPDTFVDFDHSLGTAINKLREALDDSAEHPRYIETLPRHGYRFIAAVDSGAEVPAPREDEPLPERSERRRWLAVAAVAAIGVLGILFALNVAGLRSRLLSSVGTSHGAPIPKIESIAVLPFENLSGDPEQEYFADGMTDALITDLGNIGALRVISLTSAMHYKGTKKTLPEIARELKVEAVVEAAVLPFGDQVRITAKLVGTNPERQLWAQTYERNLRDVLSLQDEVARAIANQIRIKVTPQENARLAGARPANPEAYRLYLQGRYFFFKRTVPALDKSVQLFQRALEKDPNSALAYVGLSESYANLPGRDAGSLPREVFPKAKAAAIKALELDSSLAEAHAALGLVLFFYDWDWAAAESEMKRAIELKPSYVIAHQWYAVYLSAMGRHNEAIAEIRLAQELDPASPLMLTIGAGIYSNARRYDEGIEQSRKALELDSNFAFARVRLAFGYLGKGMYEEAMAEFEEAGRLRDPDPFLNVNRARVYVEAGRQREAAKALDQLWPQYKQGKIWPLGLAPLYATLGEKQKAIDLVEEAYKQRDPNMTILKVWPYFDPLRSDPRFQAIMRRMNFPP